jgi:hypothetical protein
MIQLVRNFLNQVEDFFEVEKSIENEKVTLMIHDSAGQVY